MFDAFQNAPDLTPYDHLAAVLPFDRGPGLPGDTGAVTSSIEKAWLKASEKVMKGKYDKADAVGLNFLNHVTWYVTTGWNRPYPGEDTILTPEVLVKAAMKYKSDDDDD